MILNLPFKKSSYYTERPIEIVFDLGALEAACQKLGIEFWQIRAYVKKTGEDFAIELLYQGYVRACQTGYNWSAFQMIKHAFTKRKPLPKYSRLNAIIWGAYMSHSAREQVKAEMTELFGKIVKAYKTTPAGKKKESIK